MLLLLLSGTQAAAQSITGIDEEGNFNQIDEQGNRNFNPHNNDTTKKSKVVPKGVWVWKVDRRLGDIVKAAADTIPHLYPQSTLAMGRYGQYNTTGSNYTPRQNRIFIDRPETQQFLFTQPYDQSMRQPDSLHFTNTLSPITNLSYENCGDKQTGEDHLEAKFAVNAGKRTGIGFDLNYPYARGYFQNQSTSHFSATLYGSHLGDRYQLHAMASLYHQKVTENGGITNDNYISHPELYTDSYTDNEIPTVLQNNWNRNDSKHLFLTHRYSLGFYRKVKLTEEEIKARQFADTLNTTEAAKDSLEQLMKKEFVPVTSFIHTFELQDYERIYQAYYAPKDYYANTYFPMNADNTYQGDSIYDKTTHSLIKNTVGLALLEGFNKWMKAGIKIFGSHELRNFKMPQLDGDGRSFLQKWSEHNISIGGRLSRTQGQTLHFDLTAETWMVGEDAGQLKVDFQTDLNFPLFSDTVTLAAKAYFHRLNPTFFERNYHSKHLWWDNDLSMTTRTRIEGLFAYEKTHTRLRIAIEEMQNYTYWTMRYTNTDNVRLALTGSLEQCGSNINVLTAQLEQPLALGPLHWDNIITYQSSSQKDVLPLPTLNVFSNLYLQFVYAKVLRIELGTSATWFSKYYAPDYLPLLGQFAVQQNDETRVEIGNFPFVNVYANLHLKHARFFVMMQNVTGNSFNRMNFLTPHYALNRSVLHFGISWNFFN